MKKLFRLVFIFDRLLEGLAVIPGVMLVLVMLGISAEVIGRYFFDRPIPGMVEIAEILLLYIAFLAAAWLLREEGQVSMDFIVRRFKPKFQSLITSFTSLIGAGISFVLFLYGTKVTMSAFEKGTLQPGSLPINIGWILIVIPIGGFFLFLQFLRRAYVNWKKSKASFESIRHDNADLD
jgi:C4-dicarboxylate transporter, DctQ subunit